MRCSKCSAVVKPVVAVDIDGTLGDYHGHFLKFACAYLGRNYASLPTYRGEHQFKWWCVETLHIDQRTWHDIKLAYRQGAQKRSMPPYQGAKALCDAVVGAGGELWLTTTRPYLRLDNVDPDTRFWLAQQGIEGYHGLVYDDDKYVRLAELVDRERVVAVVDDLPEQVDMANQQFGGETWTSEATGILRVSTYNAYNGRPDLVRSESLKEITIEIVRRIAEWQQQ